MIKNYQQLAIEFEEFEDKARMKEIRRMKTRLAQIMSYYQQDIEDYEGLDNIDMLEYGMNDMVEALELIDWIKDLEQYTQ